MLPGISPRIISFDIWGTYIPDVFLSYSVNDIKNAWPIFCKDCDSCWITMESGLDFLPQTFISLMKASIPLAGFFARLLPQPPRPFQNMPPHSQGKSRQICPSKPHPEFLKNRAQDSCDSCRESQYPSIQQTKILPDSFRASRQGGPFSWNPVRPYFDSAS